MATLRDATAEVSEQTWDSFTGRGNPQERFALYRLCPCEGCNGIGKLYAGADKWTRCSDCRGEGRTLSIVATAADAAGVGVALVTLGLEGEWDDCPVGVLDTEGDTGRKWLVSPWLPSPRNLSDAGKLLRSAQTKGEK